MKMSRFGGILDDRADKEDFDEEIPEESPGADWEEAEEEVEEEEKTE